MIKYSKYLLIISIFSMLFSCAGDDPIEMKEYMIEYLKNKENKESDEKDSEESEKTEETDNDSDTENSKDSTDTNNESDKKDSKESENTEETDSNSDTENSKDSTDTNNESDKKDSKEPEKTEETDSNSDTENSKDSTDTNNESGKKDSKEPEKTEETNNNSDTDNSKDSTDTNNESNENNSKKPEESLIEQLFSFDTWKKVPGKRYSVPIMNNSEDPAKSYWVSASNFGYAYSGAPDNKYPVTELTPSKNGSGVKLETKDKLGNLVAGSLYIGHIYEKSFAIKRNPTRFGRDFNKEPVKLQLFYQYQSGGKRRYNMRRGEQDKGEVRVILYEVTEDKNFYFDKYTVKKNHDYKVLEAHEILENTNGWTEKTIKFNVVNQSRYSTLDFKNKKYRLTIMFSSSTGGGQNTGVVGSVLKIDDVTLYSKKQ